jgi:NAD-dependent SIR2 family protein deacetylase
MSDDKQCVKCLECGQKTKDFYLVPNNRGKVYKCKDCYELALSRGSRSDYIHNDIHYNANSMQR